MKMFSYPGLFNRSLTVAIVLLLAGCASTHERDQQAIADVETKYEMLIDAEPILYLLEGKIKLLPQKNWAPGQFSDHAFANESQKEAIAVYDRIATETNETLMEIAKKRDAQGKVAIFSDWMSASKENRMALYEGTISFGVFNRNSKHWMRQCNH